LNSIAPAFELSLAPRKPLTGAFFASGYPGETDVSRFMIMPLRLETGQRGWLRPAPKPEPEHAHSLRLRLAPKLERVPLVEGPAALFILSAANLSD
jgi:hypothetical protein